MEWFKSFVVPVNKELEQSFAVAAESLEKKLMIINVEQLQISAYSKKYFRDYQRKLKYSLQACSFILMHALKSSSKNMNQITIVDYGAGTGVLAMLAKEVGFGKVIYNDIYDISCNDARIIASNAGVTADEYICGEVNTLQKYFEKSGTYCDIIVSRNVIEHIYDLELYFKSLKLIPSKDLTLFFATTANIKNPLTVWYTQRIQKMLEFKGMTTKWGKERDTLKPYLTVRYEIIQQNYPELKHEEVNRLAKATRGLIKEDMIKAIDAYKSLNILPAIAVSGLNTCDPHTGNWAEHLVEIEKYKTLFKNNGFEFQVVNGFYNTNYSKKWLNIITPLINSIIKKFGKNGINLAPFIGLQGSMKAH
jgi:2-polyprenyl-3-methyl-5-hydroxy-6-metoxy-1,4-benzoquinol methylase